MIRPLRALAAVALFSLLLPAPALAQSDSDKSTARELGRTAEGHLDAQEYGKAEDEFRRADALYHAPTLVLGLARAQAKQGKYVEASENYNRIIRENNASTTAFANALTDAQVEIAAVDRKRAKVTVALAGAPTASVAVDGVPLKPEAIGIPRFMDPGPHVFKATTDDGKVAHQTVTIAEGDTQTVTLALAAPAPAAAAVPETPAPIETPSSGTAWQKTAGFVAIGVGGAFLIEGVITGAIAIGKHGSLASNCPNARCPPPQDSALSSYNTMGTLSTIGFIAGPVLAAGGVVLLLKAPKQEKAPVVPLGFHLRPWIGVGSAGASGTF